MLLLWLSGMAQAESWCAGELIAHEWGVQVFRADSAAPESVAMPSWLHTEGPAEPVAVAEPVRGLPPDTGVRTLPVVQLYAPTGWGPPVPFAMEVGFSQGEAALWFPQVDRRTPAAQANSPRAARDREALLRKRADRDAFTGQGADLGSDPTRQLGWDALTLTDKAPASVLPAEVPWVDALRAVPEALWVERGQERERFIFYEAETTEAPALVIERGGSWQPDRPHYVLHNRADWDVHDVLIVSDGVAWSAPRIPAGASAGFILGVPFDVEQTEDWLRARWIDEVQPTPPTRMNWSREDCVMMRDPAVPVEQAAGHRLYAAEVDVLLSVWAERLLAAEGTHILYREDTEALDALMPASLYTDMYHDIDWRRLGVVLVEGAALP